ncbi:hypothetical protein [Crocosphaera sp. Alani8]|uniref:hypothetical protein n=1 Tax=Crocosphaera sp. Alani8 TaxID=3038952 RepID=UPI00313AD9AF
MGEAKRRKKLDSNWGKSNNKALSIRLIDFESITDEGLIELSEKHDIKWFGEVTKNGQTSQCGLIPFNNSKTKKRILSTHLVFTPNGQQPIALNQKEVDELSTMAAKKIFATIGASISMDRKYEK